MCGVALRPEERDKPDCAETHLLVGVVKRLDYQAQGRRALARRNRRKELVGRVVQDARVGLVRWGEKGLAEVCKPGLFRHAGRPSGGAGIVHGANSPP